VLKGKRISKEEGTEERADESNGGRRLEFPKKIPGEAMSATFGDFSGTFLEGTRLQG
jgi:hypothetical protein